MDLLGDWRAALHRRLAAVAIVSRDVQNLGAGIEGVEDERQRAVEVLSKISVLVEAVIHHWH